MPVFGRRSAAHIFQTLSELHARHIVHRDIKPSNVMIDHASNLVLIDLETLVDVHATPKPSSLGTHQWQPSGMGDLCGDEFARFDVFAAGAMLTESLTRFTLGPRHGSDIWAKKLAAYRYVTHAPMHPCDRVVLRGKRLDDRTDDTGRGRWMVPLCAEMLGVAGVPIPTADHCRQIVNDHLTEPEQDARARPDVALTSVQPCSLAIGTKKTLSRARGQENAWS
jgi:serine/threonine protein kinase